MIAVAGMMLLFMAISCALAARRVTVGGAVRA